MMLLPLSFLMISTTLFANHWDNRIGGNLLRASERLYDLVSRRHLRPRVVRTVGNFLTDVRRYERACGMRSGGWDRGRLDESTELMNHGHEDRRERGDRRGPRGCRGLERAVRASFRDVDYFLNDTAYDYPRIYRISQRIGDMVYRL